SRPSVELGLELDLSRRLHRGAASFLATRGSGLKKHGAQLLRGGVAVGGPAAALVVVVEIAPAALQVQPVGRHLHEAVAVLAGEALVPDEVVDIAVELAGQSAFAIAGEGAVDLLALLAQLHAAPGGVPGSGEADAGGERIRLGVHA